MNNLSEVVSKEKLAFLNKEIELLERERVDLLYEYRLMKDKIRRLKTRTIPRLLLIGVYLIINRIIRIRQIIEMQKHVGEMRMIPPLTSADRFRRFLTNQDILYCLFIILSIYSIVLGIRLYAMCGKTERSIMPLKVAGIINVHNYSTELAGAETKITRCDRELQRLKTEADQLLQDIIITRQFHQH